MVLGEPANMARIVPAQSIPVTDYIGSTSSPLPVTSGVPQGSILGPMLFLLYVNSWPDAVRSSQIAGFADDAKIFKEITSTRDSEQLQEDLFLNRLKIIMLCQRLLTCPDILSTFVPIWSRTSTSWVTQDCSAMKPG